MNEKDSGDYTPVDVERKIRWLMNKLEEANKDYGEFVRIYNLAKFVLESRRAEELRKAEGKGSIPDREAIVVIATANEREAFYEAESDLKACQKTMSVIESQLIGMTSIGKSVNTAYNVSGVVEG